jgi:hypothetical protein
MKKNIIKIALDIVMIVVLALLYNSHAAAMSFHEIAGLAVCGLFVIHCLLNIKWIVGVSKRFFSKSLSIKVRIGYIVNLLLLVTFVFVIISGIQTSQVLFPADSHGSGWRCIHHFCAAVSIILVGVHLGLHWSFVSGMFKKAIRIKSAVIRKAIAMALLVGVLFFGAYSIATSSFTSWIAEPFVTQTKSENSKGNINDHTGKKGESKARSSEGNEHNDSTKTVDTNPAIVIGTIAKFISIMGVFAALTYYIEKIFKRKL